MAIRILAIGALFVSAKTWKEIWEASNQSFFFSKSWTEDEKQQGLNFRKNFFGKQWKDSNWNENEEDEELPKVPPDQKQNFSSDLEQIQCTQVHL